MTVATIAQGNVRGVAEGGTIAFKGIPFAAPPTGALRFLPPQPPPTWDGVRDTQTFGPTPPQMASPITPTLPPQDEDCLALSLWTPALDNKKRPVMVWIHGGAFLIEAASDPSWHGQVLAEENDIVMVSVEYRHGALGFLHLASQFGDEYATSGNNGILDQIAALQWVQENIATFGGDPGNVTIFGESAGGMSVATLMASPKATGLFHKAIAQSGAGHNALTAARATEVADQFFAAAGISPDDKEALCALPVEKILQAQMQTMSAMAGAQGGMVVDAEMMFQPVVDGIVLEERPVDAIANGTSPDIALLTGTCLDEWRLFSEMPGMPTPDTEEAIAGQLAGLATDTEDPTEEAIAGQLAGLATDTEDPTEKAAAAAKIYISNRENDSLRQVSAAIATDRVFWLPAIRLAEAHARHQEKTYMYRFSWRSPMMGGRLGACHGMELAFLFDTAEGMLAMLAGPEAPKSLGKQVRKAWTEFARTGNPTNDLLPAWPAYNEKTRATMEFLEEHTKLVNDPNSEERLLWEKAI